jgi:hypothetical protein
MVIVKGRVVGRGRGRRVRRDDFINKRSETRKHRVGKMEEKKNRQGEKVKLQAERIT